MARPSKYNKDIHPDWAWSLCIRDCTDKEIADKFGITVSTLHAWKNKYPEFSEALKEGKEPSDGRVERSLYQRAIGYTYKERKVINTIDSSGRPIPVRVEVTEKTVPPDTTAQIYWLKNRKRDTWKDKWDIELENQSDIVFNVVPVREKRDEEDGHSDK